MSAEKLEEYRISPVVYAFIDGQEQEDAYQTVKWQIPMEAPVLVIHILAVHPDYFGYGVGAALLQYAEDLGLRSLWTEMVPGIRKGSVTENHRYFLRFSSTIRYALGYR